MNSIVLQNVLRSVRDYCHEMGVLEAPGINNLVPHECVNAYAMARYLVQKVGFDHYVAVAPEGHIYGYFFKRIGIQPLAISVDYPPIKASVLDDLIPIAGGTVLIIEDDVIGGGTLEVVVSELLKFKPRRLSLFLGHSKIFQHFENIPTEIESTFIAEDILSRDDYENREREWAHAMERCYRERAKRTVSTA
jgi:hypothetical protein